MPDNEYFSLDEDEDESYDAEADINDPYLPTLTVNTTTPEVTPAYFLRVMILSRMSLS